MELKELHNSIIYLNKSIIAGMMIGIGGVIYLSCSNNIVGAFLFAVGLLTIMVFNFNLFTGKIGQARLIDTWNMILCLVGNYIGTNVMAILIKRSRIYSSLYEISNKIVNTKLSDSYTSLLILGVLCGMLMYIAVTAYNKHKNIIGLTIAAMCVTVFILSGFEHCIADMFYFALEPLKTTYFMKLFTIVIGNIIGAKLVYSYASFGGTKC